MAQYVVQTSKKLQIPRLYQRKCDCENKNPFSALYECILDTENNISIKKSVENV